MYLDSIRKWKIQELTKAVCIIIIIIIFLSDFRTGGVKIMNYFEIHVK